MNTPCTEQVIVHTRYILKGMTPQNCGLVETRSTILVATTLSNAQVCTSIWSPYKITSIISSSLIRSEKLPWCRRAILFCKSGVDLTAPMP